MAAAQALTALPPSRSTVRSDIELQLLRANVALVARRPEAPALVRTALDAAQRHGFVQTVLDTAPLLLDDVISRPDLYPAARDLGPLLTAYLDAKAMTGSRPRQEASSSR